MMTTRTGHRRGTAALLAGTLCAVVPLVDAGAAESPFTVVPEQHQAPPPDVDGTLLPSRPTLVPIPSKGGGTGPSSAHEDTFQSVYHGVLVDRELKEVELTPDLVERVQVELLDAIATALGKERLAQYEKFGAMLFEADALEHLDRPRLRSRLIEVWLDDLSERKIELEGEVSRWRERHAALRLNLPDALRLDGDKKRRLETVNRLSVTALEELRQVSRLYRWPWVDRLQLELFELIPFEWYFPRTTGYIEDCREAGVPIPPDWGDHRWERQGVLNDEFIDAGSIATVYAYRSSAPAGSCIALPRTSPVTGDASVFGIICLGVETENACFWDKYSTSAAELAGHIPIEEWISGSNFTKAAGNCSSCHAGQNPFVIHPDTPLDIGSQGFPVQVNWHDPMLPPSWANNPGPLTLTSDTSYPATPFSWWNPSTWFVEEEPGSSCVACHALPNVAHPQLRNEGYCNSVLGRAANRTMPPASFDPTEHPAGWGSSNAGDYQVHVEALNALCD